VQTTLTQKRDAFRRACTTRDRTVIEIQRKFGPQLLAMKATAGGVSWTWLEVLWQRLEKSFVGASSTNRGVKIRQLKRDFIGDVERFVESLQDIDIAVSDAQIGKAVCVWTKSRYCPKCKGKHRVTLSGWQLFIEADKNRRLQEQLREALGETDFTKLWAEFERLLKGEIVAWMQQPPDFMVDRPSCEIVCPHCCEEFTFDIPSYVEEGWILKGTTLREDSTRYVRVKKLVKPKLLLD
jgi:hypothetical protein